MEQNKEVKPFGEKIAAVLISSMILLVAEKIPLPLGDHAINYYSSV